MEIYEIINLWGVVRWTMYIGTILIGIILVFKQNWYFLIALVLLVGVAYWNGFANGALTYID